MHEVTRVDLSKYRLTRAKETLETAKRDLTEVDYLSANNRAYYSIFNSIRAILSLEPIDFKKHKDVIAYFNQHYIKNEIFPKVIGKKIAQAQRVREDRTRQNRRR